MDAHELKKAGDTPQPPDVHLLRVMGQQEAGGGNTLSGNPPEERYEEKLARFKEEVSIRLERGMDDKITTIPREPGEGPQGNDWAVGTCASASLALYVNAAHPEGPRRTADDVLEFARAAHFSRTERTLGNMLMAHRFLIIDDNAARLLHEKKADLTTHHLEELMLKKLPPHSEQVARSLSKQELIFMTRTDAQGLLEKDIGPEARERIQTGTSTITKVDVEELLQGGAFLLRGSSSSLEGKRLFFRPEERLGGGINAGQILDIAAHFGVPSRQEANLVREKGRAPERYFATVAGGRIDANSPMVTLDTLAHYVKRLDQDGRPLDLGREERRVILAVNAQLLRGLPYEDAMVNHAVTAKAVKLRGGAVESIIVTDTSRHFFKEHGEFITPETTYPISVYQGASVEIPADNARKGWLGAYSVISTAEQNNMRLYGSMFVPHTQR